MLRNVCHKLPGYDVSVSALYFGQDNEVVSPDIGHAIECIGVSRELLSIAESRNRCQAFLKQKLENEGGIGLVLDDDLRWVMPENQFSAMCLQLVNENCDMALCALAGDAPIPKEYTRASPLLDILIDVNSRFEVTQGISDFLDSVSLAEHHDAGMGWHHDFYTYRRRSFIPTSIDTTKIDWHDFLQCLYVGKTTTRGVMTLGDITPATGRERGGATIILNPDVLDSENIAFSHGGICSRRSDMMMASDAKNKGFQLLCTPAVLEHERTVAFDSHDPRKLIGDIMGYALIESYRDGSYCANRFQQSLRHRVTSTVSILQDTSLMLDLLREWILKEGLFSVGMNAEISSIFKESRAAEIALGNLDMSGIVDSYKQRFNRI
ncbi:hypothetical protein [Spongorhabdus nitratireducens]